MPNHAAEADWILPPSVGPRVESLVAGWQANPALRERLDVRDARIEADRLLLRAGEDADAQTLVLVRAEASPWLQPDDDAAATWAPVRAELDALLARSFPSDPWLRRVANRPVAIAADGAEVAMEVRVAIAPPDATPSATQAIGTAAGVWLALALGGLWLVRRRRART
ncbi:MAG: hypothetical protein RIT45_1123 [Pseudomonadota bacterium]